jgi:hypothetical protein
MEMSYCVDKGIPHSEFLSWDPKDRAKVIAYMIEQADTCSLCGTSKHEWEENPYAYEPEEEWCKGCYLKHVAAEEGGKMPGTTFTLVPVTPERVARQWVENKRRARMKQE